MPDLRGIVLLPGSTVEQIEQPTIVPRLDPLQFGLASTRMQPLPALPEEPVPLPWLPPPPLLPPCGPVGWVWPEFQLVPGVEQVALSHRWAPVGSALVVGLLLA